jgi:hypothetical protein
VKQEQVEPKSLKQPTEDKTQNPEVPRIPAANVVPATAPVPKFRINDVAQISLPPQGSQPFSGKVIAITYDMDANKYFVLFRVDQHDDYRGPRDLYLPRNVSTMERRPRVACMSESKSTCTSSMDLTRATKALQV